MCLCLLVGACHGLLAGCKCEVQEAWYQLVRERVTTSSKVNFKKLRDGKAHIPKRTNKGNSVLLMYQTLFHTNAHASTSSWKVIILAWWTITETLNKGKNVQPQPNPILKLPHTIGDFFYIFCSSTIHYKAMYHILYMCTHVSSKGGKRIMSAGSNKPLCAYFIWRRNTKAERVHCTVHVYVN